MPLIPAVRRQRQRQADHLHSEFQDIQEEPNFRKLNIKVCVCVCVCVHINHKKIGAIRSICNPSAREVVRRENPWVPSL